MPLENKTLGVRKVALTHKNKHRIIKLDNTTMTARVSLLINGPNSELVETSTNLVLTMARK
jgi:hypothetical protein